MSDLSLQRRIHPDAMRRLRGSYFSAVAPPSGLGGPETSTFEDVIWVASKPLEYVTKATAQMMGEKDPRFSFSRESTNLYDQPTFVNLLQAAGLTGGAALGLGLAADFVADPFGKLRFLGMTRAGEAARLLTTARATGTAEKVGKAWQISRKAAAAEFGKVQEFLKNKEVYRALRKLGRARTFRDRMVSSAVSPAKAQYAAARQGVRAAKTLRKDIQHTLRNIDKVNEYLRKAQKAGATLDDLTLAPTFYEQALRGQRNFLGVTGVLGGIPFYRNRDVMTQASRGFLPRGLQAQATRGAAAVGRGVGAAPGGAARVVTKLLRIAGIQAPDTAKSRVVREEYSKFLAKMTSGNMAAVSEGVRRYAKYTGKDRARILSEVDEILETLEAPEHADKRIIRDVIESAPDEWFQKTAAEKVHRPAEEVLESFGDTHLTTGQRLLLNPSGIHPNDAATAVERMRGGTSFQHMVGVGDLYYDDDFIVVKAKSAAQPFMAEMEEIKGVPGVSMWHKVDKPDGLYYVAPNYGGGVRGVTGEWKSVHIANLEKIAALLAKKGWALNIRAPGDVMIGIGGEVQIINPRALIPAKAVGSKGTGRMSRMSAARELSMRNLAQVQQQIADVPLHDFPILSSGRATQSVKARDIRFRNLDIDEDGVLGDIPTGGELLNAPLRPLVHEANNTEFIRNMTPQHLQTIGAEDILANMDRRGGMKPVPITIMPNGEIEVVGGMERLAALYHLRKHDTVPVLLLPYWGEKSVREGQQAVRLGYARQLAEVMATEASSPDGLKAMSIMGEASLIDDEVKLYTSNGRLYQPTATDVEAVFSRHHLVEELTDALLTDPSVASYVGSSDRISTALVRGVRKLVAMTLKRMYGDASRVQLNLARLASQHSTVRRFVEALATEAGDLIDLATTNTASNPFALLRPGLVQPAYSNFRTAAVGMLSDLAEKGVLVKGAQFEPVLPRGSVLVRAIDDDVLQFSSPNIPRTKLDAWAGDYLRQRMPDLDPGTRLSLVAETRGGGTAKRFLKAKKAQREVSLKPSRKRFHLPPEIAETWKADRVFLNPTKEVLEQAGVSRFPGQQEYFFFVTRSGDLIFSANPDVRSVDELLSYVFGQRKRTAQEIGVLYRDRVFIGNPFGSAMTKIGKEEVRILSDRLHGIAKRLTDLGVDPRVTLEVDSGLEPVVWRAMYGEKSVGKVAGKFRLHVPKEFEDFPLTVVDPRVPMKVVDKAERLGGPSQDLFRWVAKKNDEVLFAEVEAALPTLYTEGYFARYWPVEVRKGFDAIWQTYMGKNPKVFSYWQKAFKKRTFTDLSTPEINRLWREAKIRPDTLIKYMSKHHADFLQKLAMEAPDALEFFISDPILATTLRRIDSIRTIAKKEFLEGVADRVALFKGTPEDWRFIKTFNSKTDRLHTEYQTLQGRIEELQELIDAEVDTTRKDQLATAVSKLQEKQVRISTKVTDLMSQRADMMAERGVDLAAVDSRSATAMISMEEAKRLVQLDESNPLAELVRARSGDPFLEVPIEQMADKLSTAGTTVYVFDREVAKLVKKYFSVTNDGTVLGGFLDFYDKARNIWVQNTLFPFPKFHSRNFVTNLFMAWMGGMDNEASFRLASIVNSTYRRFDAGLLDLEQIPAFLNDFKLPSDTGGVATLNDLYTEFQRRGGITGGITFNEASMPQEVLDKAIEFGLQPSRKLTVSNLALENKLVRGGRKLNAIQENWFRFAAFIDRWRKTGSFDEAIQHVKRIFYDYNDMNMFERKFMRRVYPFYAWLRFNIPRMVVTFGTEPIKYYQFTRAWKRIQRELVDGPVQPDEVPGWIRERFGVPVATDRSTGMHYFIIGDGFLPFVDAWRMWTDPKGVMTDGLTPALKVPIEQLANRSLFTERELARVPGEKARSPSLRALGVKRRMENLFDFIFPARVESVLTEIRYVNEAKKWVDWLVDTEAQERPTLTARLVDFLLGRIYAVDPELARMRSVRDFHREIRKLQRMARLGERSGNEDLTRVARYWITRKTMERQ